MPETVEITLAKALKVKNRLAGLVSKLAQDITAYNSVQEAAEQPNVRAMYEVRKALVKHLVDLKSAITRANLSVQPMIYELAELKALIALLNGLTTKHGKFNEGYAATAVGYVAQLRRGDVNDEVRRLQAEIDRMQDQLDTFNYTTRISVSKETMAIVDGKKPETPAEPSDMA